MISGRGRFGAVIVAVADSAFFPSSNKEVGAVIVVVGIPAFFSP